MTARTDPAARAFPIIQPWRPEDKAALAGLPKSVPWDFVAPFERNARNNHGQSLQRLADRGGLCWLELLWAIQGDGWNAYNLGEAAAAAIVLGYVGEWTRTRAAAGV